MAERLPTAALPARQLIGLVDHLNEVVFETDRDGRWTYLNRAWTELTGFPVADSLGRPFLEFVFADDREIIAQRFLPAVARQDSDRRYEMRCVTREGKPRWVEAWSRLVRDGDGSIAGTVGTLTDITQRRQNEAELLRFYEDIESRVMERTEQLVAANGALEREVAERTRQQEHRALLEAQLLQAQKLEAVGRLAGGVAHDFNNLLTVILGNLEQALARTDVPESLLADLADVQDAAQSAASLTRQLLALSRKQVRRPIALDLNMHVRRLEKMLRRVIGEDVRLELDCDEQIGPILIDQSQLDQITLNLVVNARDAMASSGTITIATRARVRANDEGTDTPWVELTVADTGSGMTEDVIAHIFEPFFTTKGPEKGTGLGLATVYGIVTQSGGTIEVQTQTGEGSVFRIMLPACEEDHEPATITKSGRHVAVGRTGTVLIAEDSKEVRRLGSDALLRAGFTVLAASSGEDALRVAAQHPSKIDILLTDVVMFGMDGFTLAERLRAVRPEVQVLYTSGYSETSRFPEDLPGDAHFLEKPFTGRTLVDAIRKRLSQPSNSSKR